MFKLKRFVLLIAVLSLSNQISAKLITEKIDTFLKRDKEGKIIESDTESFNIPASYCKFSYDKKNKIKEECFLKKYNKKFDSVDYKYNDKNQLVEEIRDNGKIQYLYSYSENGTNEKISYLYDGKLRFYEKFIYNRNKLIENQLFYQNKQMIRKIKYEYSKAGVLKEIFYNSYGEIYAERNYSYDKDLILTSTVFETKTKNYQDKKSFYYEKGVKIKETITKTYDIKKYYNLLDVYTEKEDIGFFLPPYSNDINDLTVNYEYTIKSADEKAFIFFQIQVEPNQGNFKVELFLENQESKTISLVKQYQLKNQNKKEFNFFTEIYLKQNLAENRIFKLFTLITYFDKKTEPKKTYLNGKLNW